MYCSYCLREVDDWVEASGEGTVRTVVASYIEATRARAEEPKIVRVIKLDVAGYNFDDQLFPGVLHYICGVFDEDVKNMKLFGARVRARSKPPGQRTGFIYRHGVLSGEAMRWIKQFLEVMEIEAYVYTASP